MAIAIVCADVPTVIAATVRGLSLADLVAESEVVVRGRAVTERAHRHRELGIVRTVEVAVEARLAGRCSDVVEVLLLGGELETTATHVPGEADFEVGDEVVLFLASPGEGRGGLRVVGMSQGAFTVLRPPGTDQAFVARDLGPLNMVGVPEDDALGLARPCTSTFMPLEQLESLVSELSTSAGI